MQQPVETSLECLRLYLCMICMYFHVDLTQQGKDGTKIFKETRKSLFSRVALQLLTDRSVWSPSEAHNSLQRGFIQILECS